MKENEVLFFPCLTSALVKQSQILQTAAFYTSNEQFTGKEEVVKFVSSKTFFYRSAFP